MVHERANAGKNYGCVLIPEGLLGHISTYKSLFEELSTVFASCKDRNEAHELSQKFFDNEALLKEKLSPWSYSLYITIPDFIKKQILFEREVTGSVKLAQIETEKMLAQLVEEELKRRMTDGNLKGSFAPNYTLFRILRQILFPNQLRLLIRIHLWLCSWCSD